MEEAITMVLTAYADNDTESIPRRPGLYALFLDLVSPQKIGLMGRGPWSDLELQKARLLLQERVRRQLSVVRAVTLLGEVIESTKRDHLALRLRLDAAEIPPLGIVQDLASLPLSSVREYASLIKQSSLLMQPVYVGIARDQTLRDRYLQHRRDFLFAESESKFGVRLRQLGVEWDDILFACIDFERGPSSTTLLQQLEKHLHALARPALSLA